MKITIVFVLLISLSTFGQCHIRYEAQACPGSTEGVSNTVLSYEMCQGERNCSFLYEVESYDECRVRASMMCENRYLTITKYKSITATWYGDELVDENESSDFCINYPQRESEYYQCEVMEGY